MQMEGEGGREEGEREMCCLEEIHSAEEKRQTACRQLPLNFASGPMGDYGWAFLINFSPPHFLAKISTLIVRLHLGGGGAQNEKEDGEPQAAAA